jgi:hypothetical protein
MVNTKIFKKKKKKKKKAAMFLFFFRHQQLQQTKTNKTLTKRRQPSKRRAKEKSQGEKVRLQVCIPFRGTEPCTIQYFSSFWFWITACWMRGL